MSGTEDITGDPTKVRVQISYDTETLKVGIRLTDQGTGEAMMADIDPDLAMAAGERMFKVGADLKARKR